MLRIQTTHLPQDQQQRLHPDFLANEQAYLHMRDSLLPPYRGQWVAVHSGKVLVAGAKLMEVMERASTCRGHPYIALVGAEDAVVFRVRRALQVPNVAGTAAKLAAKEPSKSLLRPALASRPLQADGGSSNSFKSAG